MRLRSRNFARAGVVAGSLGLALIAGTSGAQAYTYDGTDPSSTGCSADGQTIHSATVQNAYGSTFGTIELRYSVNCHTAWARLTLSHTQGACDTASAGYACARAYIIRNNDGRQYSCKISPGQTQCYTPQVYDKDPLTSYAQSYVDGVTGEARTRTASY
ncbi:YjfA family protein [Streptomyces sp. NBC_01799]|uniref:DUF2690 domain-containing protein n=1 Tax=Streptomyces sp. NBC_01800 TaxID=2975945 RepID=UPI002DD7CF51|nr:DUF2690 domain-containing protein [Streptomyces sp. NBC_01800]WSA68567.1 YjfA family protein [Streptomyces sp. NBC_01800]WSA77180.1 YjfA family protein [Streptomyces sp. NBC_01799]